MLKIKKVLKENLMCKLYLLELQESFDELFKKTTDKELKEKQKDIKYQMEIAYKTINKQKEVIDKIKELTLQRKHCEDLFGGKEKTINDKILELLEKIE